ncbi:MAG: hypothetical protein AAB152_18620 [Candidatus Coatesbacteria bacterium]
MSMTRGIAAAGCIEDMYATSVSPFKDFVSVFPNWYHAPVASFQIMDCGEVSCPGANPIVGVTIVNYGTASGGATGDITGVSFRITCNTSDSGDRPMTFAGVWTIGTGTYPAWTWSGSYTWAVDSCDAKSGCSCAPNFYVYADIHSCATDGATIALGPSYNDIQMIGGITDTWACSAPWAILPSPDKTINAAVVRASSDTAAPGDTVTYTIFYGRRGSSAINPITIVETLPTYTHYVAGSGIPVPDVGWDPNTGPPAALKWTVPGPFSPGGGATGQITFQATVDWGNGESFEPGSGDVAAPEGIRLDSRAQVSWTGASCSGAVSNQAQATVRRFLMWMVGDNDVLFSPSYGQQADEMIYTIFLKNVSSTKTWWDVRIWDTVPFSLDAWCPGCGLEDPCQGWTMTPSGCAAATPGKNVVAGNTILTWKLDMPPQFTMTVRWKAKVKSIAVAGSTAINSVSVLEMGRTGIVAGTGRSTIPSRFAHLSSIILPTSYVSYMAFGGSNWIQPDLNGVGDALVMFPLNKKTQFELRAISYEGAGWATSGGTSDSIGCLIGDCLGGFPGSAGPCPSIAIGTGAGSLAGCKAERIPARYERPTMTAVPYQNVYKVTSNSPINWQSQPGFGVQCGDFTMYAPSTTLTYVGLMHYYWKNSYHASFLNSGTGMFFMSTGKDAYGTFDSTMPTTVHVFRFNYTTLAWDYQKSYELAGESAACDSHTLLGEEGPYRSISSQTQLIVWQGYQALSTLGCGCPCYDNSGPMPTRETGNAVSQVGSGTFYGVMQGYGNETKVSLGNVGTADASYRVSLYVPDDQSGPAEVPLYMRGRSGSWQVQGVATVPQGLMAALNPQIYGVDGSLFNAPSTAAFKVELLGGGPIQVIHGARVFTGWGGGAVLNASDGQQTGSDFWLHTTYTDGTSGASPETYAVDVFCPAKGTAIRCVDDVGLSTTYTTTGPDQCISFIGFANPVRKRNVRVTRVGGSGNVIAQYMNAGPDKGFTAPFLPVGTYYSFVTPPVVYVGQSFWITVVIMDQSGSTKTDYCGTTSFTSTDPSAKIEGSAMESFNFTWSSVSACNAAPNENGVKLFLNLTLTRLGMQSIVANDLLDGSITGLGVVSVVGVNVQYEGSPRLTIAASSDTVQFKVCWSNYSAASAFTFVMTDAVPVGMTFVPEAGSSALMCGGNWGGAGAVAYSTLASATMPLAASFSTGNPVAGTRWLRWTAPVVGVRTTGCACFRVTVN